MGWNKVYHVKQLAQGLEIVKCSTESSYHYSYFLLDSDSVGRGEDRELEPWVILKQPISALTVVPYLFNTNKAKKSSDSNIILLYF